MALLFSHPAISLGDSKLSKNRAKNIRPIGFDRISRTLNMKTKSSSEEKLNEAITQADTETDLVKIIAKKAQFVKGAEEYFRRLELLLLVFFKMNPKSESDSFLREAWKELSKSIVKCNGVSVGTVAALQLGSTDHALNYDQVFVRDFIPAGLAHLFEGEPGIVKAFLLQTVLLQSIEKKVDRFKLGDGVMPASFKVCQKDGRDTIEADFGECAIGRVAPVDSGFWWILLLHAYTQQTKDFSLVHSAEIQKGIQLILALCLSEGFDTFPTLLCTDGSCMIDRRMGIDGYPIEIQALFYMALRCAKIYVINQEDELIVQINKRLEALRYHIREYFWLDHGRLNSIHQYKTEEYSLTAVNKFNVNPDSLPDWIFDFMPREGGYFVGNVSPSRMDFRWFCVGNFVAILSSLATKEQSNAIMDLVEERWEELVGEMPLKACYPALENHEWRIVTGSDPKNTPWSYHNGGSWPVLLWLLTAVCIKMNRHEMAQKAIKLAEKRLLMDKWPEYYDGKLAQYVGKQARKFQTWSIAGYIVAKQMIVLKCHRRTGTYMEGCAQALEGKLEPNIFKRSVSVLFVEI